MKPSTVTDKGVISAIEKEMASTFASDVVCICLRASKISEKCEGRNTASRSDLAILTSKNHERA